MNNEKVLEIAAAAKLAAHDVVKAQIAKGSPNKGMSKARHIAVVADTIQEVLSSFAGSLDSTNAERDARLIMRAALSGSLLNASQFRQELEAKDCGILVKETALSTEYGAD